MPSNAPRETISVSELNAYIKTKLEGDFLLHDIALRAEISNFKSYPSGHSYFTLKDKDSMISAVMWATYASKLRFAPKDGDEVLVHGSIAVYPPRGTYQLSVFSMEPFGLGAELLRLQLLKEKLAKEGLFDESRKRPLPKFPKKVGVIAGKGSAGLRDIVVNIHNRWPLVNLIEFPSLVQGKEAPKALIDAFHKAQSENLDVLIIARGGGSSEDLGAFNDEALIRELAKSSCPIISAVGHEVDTTLADLVADKRVSTPTAAAIAAVPDKNEIYQSLDESLDRLQNATESLLRRYKQKVDYLSDRAFFKRPESLYSAQVEKLEITRQRLTKDFENYMALKKARIDALGAKLVALNPTNVLDRGYSIVLDEKGAPMRSIAQAKQGQSIKTRLKDGIIESTITKTVKE